MGWVATAIASLATVACIGASAYLNFLFMTSLGKGEHEQFVYGIFSLAVSAFVAVMPVLVVLAWRAKKWFAVLITIALFAVGGGVSLTSAVGFTASNRGETVGNREAVKDKFTSDKEELAAAEETLKGLPQARPAGTVSADIDAQKQNKIWTASLYCTQAESYGAREFCKGVFALKAELAAGEARGKLQAKIERLRDEMNALRDKGAGKETDAQAAAFARLLGVGKDKTQLGLSLLIPLALELLAAFGFYVATSHLDAPGQGSGKRERATGPMIDVTPAPAALRTVPGGRRIGGPAAVAQIAGPRRIVARKG